MLATQFIQESDVACSLAYGLQPSNLPFHTEQATKLLNILWGKQFPLRNQLPFSILRHA